MRKIFVDTCDVYDTPKQKPSISPSKQKTWLRQLTHSPRSVLTTSIRGPHVTCIHGPHVTCTHRPRPHSSWRTWSVTRTYVIDCAFLYIFLRRTIIDSAQDAYASVSSEVGTLCERMWYSNTYDGACVTDTVSYGCSPRHLHLFCSK
jgi:hypothetical protein